MLNWAVLSRSRLVIFGAFSMVFFPDVEIAEFDAASLRFRLCK